MTLEKKKNKQISKPILVAILALLLLATMPLSAITAQEKPAATKPITVTLDGKDVKLKDPVIVTSGRLYLPVALLSRMFGAQVDWNNNSEETTINTAYGDRIILGNGVPVVYFNGTRYVMDDAPFVEEGRMYIPLRDAAELLHARVNWNEEERVAGLESVPRAVVTEQFGLTEIVKQMGSSNDELLKRNGLKAKDSIEVGTKLRVVIPTLFDREAKPFTEEDRLLLAKITQVEVGDESYESQLAVANVILNRVKDSRFPKTIRDVIYSGKQFPPAHNGLLDRSVPKATALRAAKDALNGKNNVEGAVYFYNPRVTKGDFWSGLSTVGTIGSHRFAK